MAKRRAKKSRSRSYRTPRRTKGRRKSSMSSSVSIQKDVLIPAGYGAVREPISDFLVKTASKSTMASNILSGIAGNADEALMGLLNYSIAKGKIPILGMKFNAPKIVREMAKVGLHVEASRIGSQTIGQAITNRMGGLTSTNGGSYPV